MDHDMREMARHYFGHWTGNDNVCQTECAQSTVTARKHNDKNGAVIEFAPEDD